MRIPNRPGFSLIELIIVVAIIAIIAAAVFVAIDPARRIHASRNAQRWADVTALLEGVKKYQADNEGDLPATATAIDSVTATNQIIGENVSGCGTSCSCVSESCATLTSAQLAVANCGVSGLDTDLRPYLKTIPSDGKTGSGGNTRYYINKDQYGIITVGSCDAEGEGGGGDGAKPLVEVTR